MDVFYAYTYGTAGWLALQAIPLLITPKVIITMLSKDIRNATELEIYFSRCLGIALLTIALTALFFTGSIPLSSGTSEPISTEDSDPKAPYAVPILRLTMIYHGMASLYAYLRFVKTGQTGFALGIVGSGIMAAVGLWCVMFATSAGRISKRTGADKRTSGFPFKNTEAAKRKIGKRY